VDDFLLLFYYGLNTYIYTQFPVEEPIVVLLVVLLNAEINSFYYFFYYYYIIIISCNKYNFVCDQGHLF